MPKRPRDRIDNLIRRMWIAFVALAAIVASVGWLWVHDITDRLERAELAICERVQRVRMNTNRNSVTLYEGIRVFVGSPNQPPVTKRRLERLAGVPQYQHPTNCRQAVRHPDTYRPARGRPVADLSGERRRRVLRTGR